MAGITGIGSGMDIDGMVKALANAEKAPKEAQLNRLETATTTKISALGTLRQALSGFQTALNALNDTSLFENRSAASSNTSLLTATASKTAQSGSYSLKVEQLATGSKTATAALADSFETTAAGTLTVKVGAADAGISVDIAEGASLAEIRDALNSALSDSGVTANLVTNPADGQTRLVMSSSNTGEGKDVSIESSVGLEGLSIGSGSLDASDPTSSGVLEAAQNAKFSIDGLSLESATNTVEGAIPEVSFNLKAADNSKTVTVTVGQDRENVTANIEKFVEAYNKLITTTNTLTQVIGVGEEGKPLTGGLVGDSSVRNLLSGVQRELSSSTGQGGIRILADLGITTQKDGTLAVDDDTLSGALDKSFDAVAGFFTGDTGLMNRLDNSIDAYTQTDGILAQRVSGLEGTTADIKEQREDLALRVESLTARLYSQFNAMDSMVAQLSNTSTWLSGIFDSLPGVVKQSK